MFKLLSKTMLPEFLNRVEEIIMFNPLSEETVKQVVAIQWRQVQEHLNTNGISLVAGGLVIEYLAQKDYNPQCGARPLKHLIQRDILNKLSSALLADELGSSASI